MEKSGILLLIEDETDVLHANAEYLSALGYEIHCAKTLREARAVFWENPPDLVLLDIMMPDGSGLDFCGEIRDQTSAPIIFLTCLGEDSQVVTGLDSGGDDYIVKPYSMEVLAARVASQLRRNNIGSGRISLPPLLIDRDAGVVTLSGDEIRLTPRELQLLCYLADRQGKAFSQAQLFEAIWGADASLMGATVRVTVSRLRQKLHLDDSSYFELLATPNQGYTFVRVRYPKVI